MKSYSSAFLGLILGFSPTVGHAATQASGKITSTATSSASIAIKMNAFEMPPEYNCPLFSNSPYTDMLNSLDKMQENLNSVFPQCENKATNVKLNETSDQLHKKVIEAQALQKSGQTFKLNQNAFSIVELTRTLQQSLVSMSTVQTKACYRSEAQFRNVIFSINDTFQSLSPLILDLATQNPELTATLGPALKIFAGADAISKGLSLIEQIAKDSVQFDMSDKENRMNTVKNTCQFMKLYNRLSYLRLSRLGQVQTIHTKFQTEIAEINKTVIKVNANKSKEISGKMNAGGVSETSTGNSSLKNYENLKISVVEEQSRIQKTLADFEQAKDDNFPEITQCQVVQSSVESISLELFKLELSEFSMSEQIIEKDVASALSVLLQYKHSLKEAIAADDKKLCAKLGQDWLRKTDQLFLLGKHVLALNEIALIELNGEAYVMKQKKISKDAEKLKSVQTEYNNLKTMLNYAAFESSEVEKRAKGMHKYLFAGPDKVTSECTRNPKDEKCDIIGKISGGVKAYYQEYRNQGPVYELLLNNAKYYEDSFKKMKAAMSYIQSFEHQFYKVINYSQSHFAKPHQDWYVGREKHAFLLSHLNSRFLAKGTTSHANVCSQAKVVVNEYLKATNHMMSTFGMCDMIKNVLKEPEVSAKLKNYCFPYTQKESELDRLRFRLAGQYAEGEKDEFHYTYFSRSPKAFVDTLLVRMDELGCYSN